MDDEQRKDEETQDEGDGAAGPVSDTSSSPTGEDPASSPPAADSAEEVPSEEGGDEGPSEEAEVAEEPVAEEVTSPEPDQEVEAEKPKAEEKKKDVIPGADLEPILVEPDKPELSAEEKARREAELAATEDTDAAAASRAPAKIEKGARFLATGKRKSSIARVTLLPGNGKIEINKRSIEEFFPRPLHQTMVKQPLTVSGYEGNVDVRVRVHGGGISGQAGAIRHGVARALTEIDSELRGDLKRRGFLTRDARVKERRKAGLKKARKRPQFSKR